MKRVRHMVGRSKKFLGLGTSDSLFDPVSRAPLMPLIFFDRQQWNKLGPKAGILGGPDFPKNEKIKISVKFKYLCLPPLMFSSCPNLLFLKREPQGIFKNIFGDKISLVPLESTSPMAVEIEKEYKACFFNNWLDPIQRDISQKLFLRASKEFSNSGACVHQVYSWKKIRSFFCFRDLLDYSWVVRRKIWNEISDMFPESRNARQQKDILIWGEQKNFG